MVDAQLEAWFPLERVDADDGKKANNYISTAIAHTHRMPNTAPTINEWTV